MNKIQELESLRIKIKNTTLIMYLIIGIYVVFSFFFLFNFNAQLFAAVLGITTLIMHTRYAEVRRIYLVITTLITHKKYKEFRKMYKDIFVSKSIEKTFDNVEFDADKGIDKSVIANTKMMSMGNCFYSNDYVKAVYKDVGFEQSDVKIEEEHTDSKGRTTHSVKFSGKWMIFDFNKSFKADIQVCDKRFTNSNLGGLLSAKKFLNIKLEDIEFNKMFTIHAKNEHDAFYILTPHIMQSIKRLKNNIKGSILLCFINNKLHVGLQNGKDSFEVSIWKKIDKNEINQKLDREIKEITNFIDELELDKDLFRKEVNNKNIINYFASGKTNYTYLIYINIKYFKQNDSKNRRGRFFY